MAAFNVGRATTWLVLAAVLSPRVVAQEPSPKPLLGIATGLPRTVDAAPEQIDLEKTFEVGTSSEAADKDLDLTTRATYGVYGIIDQWSPGADADGDGYYETFSFRVGVDADAIPGPTTVYAKIICTTTGQAWWSASSWSVTGTPIDYRYFAFSQADFAGKFSGNASLDFTVEIWNSSKTTKLATDTGVTGEPIRADSYTPPSFAVYSQIMNWSAGTDADNDGYYESYYFEVGIDGDVTNASATVVGKIICTTTGQSWWTTSWNISGTATDYARFAFDQTDFAGYVSGNTNLDFTVELWNASKTTRLATDASVTGEPIKADKLSLPDLVPQTLSLSQTSVAPGGTLTVSFSISNNGNGLAGLMSNQIRLTNTSGVNVLLGTRNLSQLAAQSSSLMLSETVTIPANTAAGTYAISVTADAGSTVPETNEGNNTSTTPLMVTTVAAKPNLVVESISASHYGATAGSTSLSVTVTVRNTTGTSSPAFSTQLFLQPSSNPVDSTDRIVLSTLSFAALGGGQSRTTTATVSVGSSTAKGTYRLFALADSKGEVFETDDSVTNNSSAADNEFEVYDSPSLVPWAGDTSAVGDRIPLIMIHGIRDSATRWTQTQGLLPHLWTNTSFKNTYKVYLFEYPASSGFTPSNTPNIYSVAEALSGFIATYRSKSEAQGGFGSRKLAFVTHSQGGLVARSFLEQHSDGSGKGGERTLAVFTLGTPHHGVFYTADFFSVFGVATLLPHLFIAHYSDMAWDEWTDSNADQFANRWLRCLNNVAQDSCDSNGDSRLRPISDHYFSRVWPYVARNDAAVPESSAGLDGRRVHEPRYLVKTTFWFFQGDCGHGDLRHPDDCRLESDTDVSFRQALREDLLSLVRVKSNANGTVTGPVGSVKGLNCGPSTSDCSDVYGRDTNITLTAAPRTGYRFTGWSIARANNSSATCLSATPTTCTFTASDAPTVEANFVPIDSTLPVVQITGPTSGTAYSASSTPITLSGSANDSSGVVSVTWTNNRGGSGTATGTTSWSASIPLLTGDNIVTVTARDPEGNVGIDTITITYSVATAPTIATSSPLAGATVGVSYSAQLQGQGGTPPYSWLVASGALPGGLALGISSGTISGTPTSAGNYTFSVQITGSNGLSSSKSFSLSVAAAPTVPSFVTSSPLAGGTVGSAYAVTLVGQGGLTPYAWSIISGSAPPGLSLSAGGAFSGTPTTSGTYSFTIQLSGANGVTTSGVFSISIQAAAGGGGGGPVQLLAGLSNPNEIALDATYVYWIEFGGRVVRRLPKAGGAATTLASTGSNPTALAVDDSYVYYAENGIRRVPKAGGSSTLILASRSADALATNGGYLYFADFYAGTIERVPTNGGGASLIASGANSPAALAFDATHVYWVEATNPGAVRRAPLAGGTVSILATDANSTGIVVADGYVYWAENVSTNNGRIVRVPIAGGTKTSLVSGLNGPWALAADAANVYWAEFKTTGAVRQAPKSGGTPLPIVVPSPEPVAIAVDDGNVYWINRNGGGSNGQLWRAPKQIDSAAPTIAISAPTNGTPYSTASPSISVSGTAADNVGVVTVSWVNDRGGNGGASGTTAWNVAAINLQPGANAITMRAYDAAGNVGLASITINYVVTDQPPDTSILNGPSGTIMTQSATFSWTGSDAQTPVGALLYGTRLDPIETSYTFSASTTRTLSQLSNGTYTFFVKARDAAGNDDPTPASRTFAVASPVDPLLDQQWHLKPRSIEPAGANATTAWSAARGNNIVIGTVDDGVDYSHPDLQPAYVAPLSRDFNDNDPDPRPTSNDRHGTAVAGVAAARGENGVGGSGTAPQASIAGLRLVAAPSTDAQEAAAFGHQLDAIHVLNNSWGPSDDGATLRGPGPLAAAALENAAFNGRTGKGRVTVFAAGNGGDAFDNCNADGYANSRFVIPVGALNDGGSLAYFSEPCSALMAVAPSNGGARGITTTDLVGTIGYDPGNYTSGFGGTSAAAPQVSGVAALMLQRNPALGWRDIKHILARTSVKIDSSDPGWSPSTISHNEKYGFGLVDAAAAVTLAATWTPVAPEAAVFGDVRAFNLAIPDEDDTGVSDSITVDSQYSGFSIEHVEVELSAQHAYRGDLEIALIDPNGVVSELMTRRPYDSGTTFSAWKLRSVRHWGASPVGEWTLQVRDKEAGYVGTWTRWTIRFFGTTSAPSESRTKLVVNGVAAPSPLSVVAGTQVGISVSNGPAAAGDWVAVAPVGSPDQTYSDWRFLSGTKTSPAATRNATFSMPVPSSGGQFEYRLFLANSFTRLATSGPVSVRTVSPVPSLTGLAPATAVAGSGALILTATGTGFVSGLTSLQVNGSPRPTAVTSSTQLSASLPASDLAAVGALTISVTTPAPGGGTSTTAPLVIVPAPPPPSLGGLTPSTLAVGSATAVNVTGSSFTQTSFVSVDNVARATTFISTSQLSFAGANLAPGPHSVVVTTPAPGGGTSAALTLTVIGPTLTVAASAVSPGGVIAISLADGPGTDRAWLALARVGSSDSEFLDWTYVGVNQAARTWNVTAPSLLGTYEGRLFVNGYVKLATSPVVTVAHLNPTPTLASLTPSSLAAGSAAFVLRVTGTGFVPGLTTLRVGGASRAATILSSTLLTTSLSASDVASVGGVPIAVANPSPGGGSSNAVNLVVTPPPSAPVIAAVTPANVTVGATPPLLHVTGANFVGTSQAHIDGVARSTNVVSETQLTIQLQAADLTTGVRVITIVTPAPGGGTSNSVTFTVIGPTLTASTTAVSPGASLSFALANGPGSDRAWFALARVGSSDFEFLEWGYVGLNQTNRLWTVPAPTAPGIYEARLFVNGYTKLATSGAVTVAQLNPAPTIASISPASLAAGSASFTLNIAGTGFMPGRTQLRINGIVRASIVVSSTNLTAAMAATDVANVGSLAVAVANPAPGGGTSATVNLNVTAPPAAPTASSVTPSSATVGAAPPSITLTGTNFTGTSQLRVDGSARPTVFVSQTQLTAQLFPSDLTVGVRAITVMTPAPGGGTSNAVHFTVTGPTLTAGASAVSPGGTLAFALTNGPGTERAWFALARVGSSDFEFVAWSFVGVNQANRTWIVTAPATLGAYEARLFVNGYTRLATSGAVTVAQLNPAPTIASFAPASLAAGSPAFVLNVAGTGFMPGRSQLRVNGLTRATTVLSPSQLTGTILASDVANIGSLAVTVVNPTPGGGTSGTVSVSVTAPPAAPTLATVTPSSFTIGSPVTLVATGANFTSGSRIRIDGVDQPTSFESSTRLTAAVSASVASGVRAISVWTPSPGGGVSNSINVTATGPVLTASPLNASAGTPVTVTLTNGPAIQNAWLALARTGTPDMAFLHWTYVGNGLTNRTWTVTPPGNGSYEIRLFVYGYTKLATSPTIRVP